MKRKILMFILVLTSLSLQVKAQYFEHDLRTHTWVATEGFLASGVFDLYLTFTKGNVNFVIKDKSGAVLSDFDYKIYLTSQKDETHSFDYTQVGKDLFGKFIMMDHLRTENGKKVHDMKVAEIISFSDDTLILYLEKKKLTFVPVQ